MYHHIHESSMEGRVLDMLSAHQTDAEFERQKECNKILADCKEKGFPMLKKKGLFPEISKQKRKIDVRNEVQNFSDEKRIELLNQVCESIRNGESIGKACKKVDMNQRTVRHWSKKFGIKIPRSKTNIEQVQWEIMERTNAGESIRKIAAEYGVTGIGVKYALARHGYAYEYDSAKRVGKFVKEVD